MRDLNFSSKAAGRMRSGGLLALFLLAALPALVMPLRADSPPTYLFAWGSPGSGDSQFNFPLGIAVDSSTNVYVVDGDNIRIEKFDANGNYLTQWKASGTFYGIAVDHDNNVYVTDFQLGHIEKYDSNGNLLIQWGSQGSGNGQFSAASGIAFDSSNNVYVSEEGNDRIQKFDPNGNYLAQWGTSGRGNGQFNEPFGLAIDSSNNVYVADTENYRVQKFDSNGNYLTQWGSFGSSAGLFNEPTGIAVDSSNRVYVSDTGNANVQKFDSNGNYLTQWGGYGVSNGQFGGPFGITVDASGNFIYVVDNGNNRIEVFANSTAQLRPYITSQSTSQTVVAGTNVSLSVTAVGATPLTYQWTSNTVALSNVTNSALTLANVTLADAATYAVLVTNGFGSTISGNIALAIVPAFVSTLPPTGISAAGAVLNGSATIAEDTTVWFNWGTDTNYGNSTATIDVPGYIGTTNVSFALNGLSTNLYHYQVVVSNISGIVLGNDQSFLIADSRPTCTTLSPVNTMTDSALYALVNPNGLDTSVFFKWGISTGTLSNSTPPVDIGAGAVSLAASSVITGLSTSSLYSYQAVASNALGTTTGATIVFLPPPFTGAPLRTWQSVATSADGSKLVAAANSAFGAPGGIYLSTNNGSTWIDAFALSVSWESVASSADGAKLIIASGLPDSGSIYTSTNSGSTFALATNVGLTEWSSVTSSATGTRLAAAAENDAAVFVSVNSGTNWVPHGGVSSPIGCVVSSANGLHLLAATQASTVGPLYVSANGGTNWTKVTNAPTAHWYDVASSADGNHLFACSYPGNVYVSANAGLNWTETSLPSNNWNSVAESADGTKAVALANSGSPALGAGNGGIWTSTNSGTTWVTNNVPSAAWTAAAMSADGNEFVASIGYPSTTGGIYVSQTTPAPVLNLTSTSSQSTISWIIPSVDFTLQESSNLLNWSNVTNAPVLNDTNLENQVILPLSGGNNFFRLKSN